MIFPYKIQICQKLHEGDFARRVTFCEWLLRENTENANFLQNLIVSDEAHFGLNESVNKQNVRFWVTENPEELREIPLHSEKVTVWCGMTSNEIIGPYFFEEENGRAITVNGERYHTLITDFLIPKVNEMNAIQLYFHLPHYETEHGNPSSEVSGETDLKIWRCRVACKIARSLSFRFLLMGTSKGKSIPRQSKRCCSIEGSH